MRQYTREVVTRYKDSPAIWGWEFGNEIMLAADLHMPQHRPPVWLNLGTPASRTERDEITSEAARYAQTAFAEEVRKYDKSRIILSGNACPRAAAWHLSHGHTWTQDTREQFAESLLADNADPIDTICIHMYPDATGQVRPQAHIRGTTSPRARHRRQSRQAALCGGVRHG